MKELNLSRCRIRARELMQKEESLIKILIDRKVMVKGSVFKMLISCGKKQCKCYTKHQLHSAWRLSRSHEGKPQSRYLAMSEVPEYKKLTDNYRRFRKARADLVKLRDQWIELINIIEKAKTKEVFK